MAQPFTIGSDDCILMTGKDALFIVSVAKALEDGTIPTRNRDLARDVAERLLECVLNSGLQTDVTVQGSRVHDLLK